MLFPCFILFAIPKRRELEARTQKKNLHIQLFWIPAPDSWILDTMSKCNQSENDEVISTKNIKSESWDNKKWFAVTVYGGARWSAPGPEEQFQAPEKVARINATIDGDVLACIHGGDISTCPDKRF